MSDRITNEGDSEEDKKLFDPGDEGLSQKRNTFVAPESYADMIKSRMDARRRDQVEQSNREREPAWLPLEKDFKEHVISSKLEIQKEDRLKIKLELKSFEKHRQAGNVEAATQNLATIKKLKQEFDSVNYFFRRKELDDLVQKDELKIRILETKLAVTKVNQNNRVNAKAFVEGLNELLSYKENKELGLRQYEVNQQTGKISSFVVKTKDLAEAAVLQEALKKFNMPSKLKYHSEGEIYKVEFLISPEGDTFNRLLDNERKLAADFINEFNEKFEDLSIIRLIKMREKLGAKKDDRINEKFDRLAQQINEGDTGEIQKANEELQAFYLQQRAKAEAVAGLDQANNKNKVSTESPLGANVPSTKTNLSTTKENQSNQAQAKAFAIGLNKLLSYKGNKELGLRDYKFNAQTGNVSSFVIKARNSAEASALQEVLKEFNITNKGNFCRQGKIYEGKFSLSSERDAFNNMLDSGELSATFVDKFKEKFRESSITRFLHIKNNLGERKDININEEFSNFEKRIRNGNIIEIQRINEEAKDFYIQTQESAPHNYDGAISYAKASFANQDQAKSNTHENTEKYNERKKHHDSKKPGSSPPK